MDKCLVEKEMIFYEHDEVSRDRNTYVAGFQTNILSYLSAGLVMASCKGTKGTICYKIGCPLCNLTCPCYVMLYAYVSLELWSSVDISI